MNENINIAEILKDAPKGTKLYSALHGEVTLVRISNYEYDEPIMVKQKDGLLATFNKDGKILKDGECLLFPSKENRDWSAFKVPQKHKHFEAFQKVLYKSYNNPNKELIWTADFYSHYCNRNDVHYTIASYCGIDDADIIPFEGNENKIGKPAK